MPNTKDSKSGNKGNKSSEKGFGAMDSDKQREMAGKGGKTSHGTRNENESSRKGESREGGR